MLARKLVAEFVGTFALVFIGCGAIIAQSVDLLGGIITGAVVKVNPASYITIAFAFGLTFMVMVYAAGHISGAHFNPAVTLGLAVAGRFPWRFVPIYIVVQCVGAIVASLIHWSLLAEGVNVDYGATTVGMDLSDGTGFLLELILTFFFMFVVMAAVTDKRFPSAASGLAIGMTITLCTVMGFAFTGASMNPARSLGPALFSAIGAEPKALQQLWKIYIPAPIVGAVVAAILYEFLRPAEFAKAAPEDLMAFTAEEGETEAPIETG